MPYNPTVRNQAGQIYGQGITGGADAMYRGITGGASQQASGIMQGANSMASGISSAGSSLGSGIAQAGQIWQQQAAKKAEEAALFNAVQTKVATMKDYGILSPQDLDALAGLKNTKDMNAALSIVENQIQMRAQQQQAITQSNLTLGRQQQFYDYQRQAQAAQAQQNAQQYPAGQTGTITNPADPNQTIGVYRQQPGPSGQIVQFPQPRATPTPPPTGITRKDMGNGQYYYQDSNGNIVNPNMVKGGNADVTIPPPAPSSPAWYKPWTWGSGGQPQATPTPITEATPQATPSPTPGTMYRTTPDVQRAVREGKLSPQEGQAIIKRILMGQ